MWRTSWAIFLNWNMKCKLIRKLPYWLATVKPLHFTCDCNIRKQFLFCCHLITTEADKELWNDFITGLPQDERSYFKARWLYAECYMYRRLKSIFEHSWVTSACELFEYTILIKSILSILQYLAQNLRLFPGSERECVDHSVRYRCSGAKTCQWILWAKQSQRRGFTTIFFQTAEGNSSNK